MIQNHNIADAHIDSPHFAREANVKLKPQTNHHESASLINL